MSKQIFPPRGMNDSLPLDVQRKEEMIQAILPIYKRWGFVPIECPAIENIDRLVDSGGGDNEKLVFQILRRGLKKTDYEASVSDPSKLVDMGLRYDLTVPMSRFYATNHSRLPKVSKLLQYGSVWRAERPQKGRFRQFMQWDADVVGGSEGLPEIELILCTSEALLALGFNDFVVKINDRRVLKALVNTVGIPSLRHNEVFVIIDKLDKVGLPGIQKEMTDRGYDEQSLKKLIEKLSLFLDLKKLPIDECLDQLQINVEEKTIDMMKTVVNEVVNHSSVSSDYSIVFDPTLARGMGYYTGQIFEIEFDDYPFSIAGGGRYDGLINRFIGRDVPACGFSLGFDRIFGILNERDMWPSKTGQKKLLLLIANDDVRKALIGSSEFRAQGWDVSIAIKEKNVKRQVEEYKSIGFTHFSIFDAGNPIEVKDITI